MNLELDFVRPARRYTLAGGLVLLAGIAAAGLGTEQYFATGREIAALERELALQTTAGARSKNTVDVDRLRARIVQANQVVHKKTVPWDGLFRDIENASSSQIGLLAVEPDAATGLVRISGEARDAAALTEYIERLAAQSSLKNVHLAGHEVKTNQGRAIVRFSLNATWTGAQS